MKKYIKNEAVYIKDESLNFTEIMIFLIIKHLLLSLFTQKEIDEFVFH